MAADSLRRINPTHVLAESLKLPLGRPQYSVAPEAYISSLLWTVVDAVPSGVSNSRIRMVYKKLQEGPKSYKLFETMPQGGDLQVVGKQLMERGVSVLGGSPELLGEAVAESVLGTKSGKGKSQSASPMSGSLALMQNLSGLLNTDNPPDLGNILESLYRLGAPEQAQMRAADRLFMAMKQRASQDPLLKVIDLTFSSVIFSDQIRYPANAEGIVNPWAGLLDDTPFHWLNEKWNKLTREDWITALPARVWVDWAATVLRLALGMCYLWEAAWYEAMSRVILGKGEPSWDNVRASMAPPLIWSSARLQPSMRDVLGPMRRRLVKGYALRTEITAWLDKNENAGLDCRNALLSMRQESEFCNLLLAAFSEKSNKGENAIEAVQYSLMTREDSGPYADYYGLLRKRGNFYVPEPGVEWIAVVASLSCEKPGGQCDLGQVLADLSALGARPDIRDLTNLLERAGLARGSADADQGVVVQSAF